MVFLVCIPLKKRLTTLDALEKKYLREIVFSIYNLPVEDAHCTLIEAYHCIVLCLLNKQKIKFIIRRRERLN